MAEPRICSIPGCGKHTEARGWCKKHYSQWHRRGDPLAPPLKFKQPCRIPGCVRMCDARGLCNAHYRKWRLYGDPSHNARTETGKAPAYFQQVVLPFNGEECLIWPFAKSETGYGSLHIPGNGCKAVHRLVCETVHGPAPSSRHLAAHNCGNRSCCNPIHIRWATPGENQLDRVPHGTHARGTRQLNSKLTEDDVKEIRQLLPLARRSDIAKIFGVTAAAIYRIEKRKAWAWLD